MAWIEKIISEEKRKHHGMPFGSEKYNHDWAQLAEDKILESIMDYGCKNNTIPMTELRSIECVCGHSLFAHESPDVIEKIGGACSNKFCTCTGYKKKEQNSNMMLAMTDGGWLNVLKLRNFLNGVKNE